MNLQSVDQTPVQDLLKITEITLTAKGVEIEPGIVSWVNEGAFQFVHGQVWEIVDFKTDWTDLGRSIIPGWTSPWQFKRIAKDRILVRRRLFNDEAEGDRIRAYVEALQGALQNASEALNLLLADRPIANVPHINAAAERLLAGTQFEFRRHTGH